MLWKKFRFSKLFQYLFQSRLIYWCFVWYNWYVLSWSFSTWIVLLIVPGCCSPGGTLFARLLVCSRLTGRGCSGSESMNCSPAALTSANNRAGTGAGFAGFRRGHTHLLPPAGGEGAVIPSPNMPGAINAPGISHVNPFATMYIIDLHRFPLHQW